MALEREEERRGRDTGEADEQPTVLPDAVVPLPWFMCRSCRPRPGEKWKYSSFLCSGPHGLPKANTSAPCVCIARSVGAVVQELSYGAAQDTVADRHEILPG